jgi:hypothetical protein
MQEQKLPETRSDNEIRVEVINWKSGVHADQLNIFENLSVDASSSIWETKMFVALALCDMVYFVTQK